jgi:hypothetical protein
MARNRSRMKRQAVKRIYRHGRPEDNAIVIETIITKFEREVWKDAQSLNGGRVLEKVSALQTKLRNAGVTEDNAAFKDFDDFKAHVHIKVQMANRPVRRMEIIDE